MKKQVWIALVVASALVTLNALAAFAAGGLTMGDKKFVMDAANGGMMEVQLGQMAQKQAESADVKNFGTRMVTDHSKANDDLQALAQQKNVTLPAQADHKMKKDTDKLASSTGADFDHQYMQMMVKDHVKDVAEFRKAAKKCKDADLKAWAVKTLPTLEQHLQQAKEIALKLGMKTK